MPLDIKEEKSLVLIGACIIAVVLIIVIFLFYNFPSSSSSSPPSSSSSPVNENLIIVLPKLEPQQNSNIVTVQPNTRIGVQSAGPNRLIAVSPPQASISPRSISAGQLPTVTPGSNSTIVTTKSSISVQTAGNKPPIPVPPPVPPIPVPPPNPSRVNVAPVQPSAANVAVIHSSSPVQVQSAGLKTSTAVASQPLTPAASVKA